MFKEILQTLVIVAVVCLALYLVYIAPGVIADVVPFIGD